jgi:hypothetical protein
MMSPAGDIAFHVLKSYNQNVGAIRDTAPPWPHGILGCRSFAPMGATQRGYVIYSAYIDVSGGHAGSPVMVMGGYIGRLGQWQNLDRQFGLLLKRSGLTYHHTRKMFHGNGEYAGWTRPQKIRYINKVGRIIDRNTLCGFTVRMTHEDYEKHFKAGDGPKGLRLDSKYGVCFRLFLSYMPRLLDRSFQDIQLHIVLEAGDAGIGDSEVIFASYKKEAPSDLAEMVKSLTVADKKKYYGLQIADWAAYAAFHAEQDGPQLTEYPLDANFEDASKLVSYNSPVFRLDATPAVLVDFRQRLITQIEEKRGHWHRRRKLTELKNDASEGQSF